MIRASELRLGNWVHVDDDGYGNSEDVQIRWIDPEEHGESMDSISPIPLADVWLERADFEYDSFFEKWWLNPKFTDMGGVGSVSCDFSLDVIDDEFVFSWEGKELIVKSVHQLQNLYFALTGKELIFKFETT